MKAWTSCRLKQSARFLNIMYVSRCKVNNWDCRARSTRLVIPKVNKHLDNLTIRGSICWHYAELESSWRHGQPRSRPTWNRSQGRESSAMHDRESTGWKCLASSQRTAELGVPPSETWSTPLVNADANKQECNLAIESPEMTNNFYLWCRSQTRHK